MQQYGAKLLQGLGYLRRLGCLPEGVLAAGQTGSSLVFLFGVIGVDAGKEANHPSTQVSKYPGAKFDPRAVPDSHDAVCRADPHVQLLRAPYVDSPRVPLMCLPGYPPGVDRACSCSDEGLDGLPDHLPMVTLAALLTGPLYEEGWRVPLGWYCSSVIHHKHTHLLG